MHTNECGQCMQVGRLDELYSAVVSPIIIITETTDYEASDATLTLPHIRTTRMVRQIKFTTKVHITRHGSATTHMNAGVRQVDINDERFVG
jgi:hypothetical protein